MVRKTYLLCLLLAIFASSMFAQNAGSKNIQLANVTLKEFFQVVEEQCGYTFMYSNTDIDDSKSVSINAPSGDIENILKQAFQNKDVSYEINSNQIILTKTGRQALAQAPQSSRTIKGVIKDEFGDGVIGAAIRVVGTTVGTATDLDGNFSLDIPSDAKTLHITYVGYEEQMLNIGKQSNFNITLKESSLALEEVVVIGYGTLKKKDLTAAISSLSSDDIATRAATNPAEALQGLVSGVNVLKADGLAGSSVSVKIRGVNTFGSNEPLYIIDGFPGDINNINSNDIESIEILKDGAAAAIYGSVAANGVVLITTKGGKKGKITVDLNSYVSVRTIARKLKLLDSEGYVKVHNEMYDNYYKQYPSASEWRPAYLSTPIEYNTDWQDAIFRSGVSLNQSVSVRGGFDDTRFALSGNISDDKGIVIHNKFQKQNVRTKISTKKNIFTIEGNLAYTATKFNSHNVRLKEAYMISPLVPIYDADSENGYGLTNRAGLGLPSNVNVIADSDNRTGWSKRQNFTGSGAIGIDIMEGLNFRTSYGYRANNYQYFYHHPAYTANPQEVLSYPWYEEQRNFWEEQIFDNVLNYTKDLGQHSFSAMVGTSMTKQSSNWSATQVEGKTLVYDVRDGKVVNWAQGAGFTDPNYMSFDAGKGATFSANGSNYRYNRMSYFGRLNYAYGTRYLFQFTMRRDGSSKLHKSNRWANFPSVAIGWRINEEAFFPKVDAISNLKLRASWGKLGNEVVLGYYERQSLITTGNNNVLGSVQGDGGTPWPGAISQDLASRNLKWETTESINIGLDYGFLNNTIHGSINYFNHKTKDLLITKRLPSSSGLNNPTLNVGEIRNSGVEFEINYIKATGDFQYSAGLNMSYLNNKVLKLAREGEEILGTGIHLGDSHYANKTVVGKPIGAFFLYETDGLFQNMDEVNKHVNADGKPLQANAQPGDIRFKDVNGDGSIDEKDKTYQGTGMPKLEVNLNLAASYKGFDLSALIGSGWGHKLYNANRFYYEGMNSGSNFMRTTLNSWRPDNTNTSIPRAMLGDPNNNMRESDRYLENGNFVRLRQVQIGYTLPKDILSMLRLEHLRFYVSGENLATWTKYKGMDPEFSSDVLNTGVDGHVFPFTRSYVFGLQLTF